jgi:hypothetical protein
MTEHSGVAPEGMVRLRDSQGLVDLLNQEALFKAIQAAKESI